jgi:tetratricopeptide (TPR) repeat protein
MDILYTVDEKYLQAVEELHYGELPKALHFFNEIINTDPDYARAYYQLGSCYYYQFKNYQTAGFYFKKCIELDVAFPEVYEHHLKLLITLKMHKSVQQLAEKALGVPGVCKATIYESLGLYAEENQNLDLAREQYKLAAMATSCQTDHTLYEEHLKRIKNKLKANNRILYTYKGN